MKKDQVRVLIIGNSIALVSVRAMLGKQNGFDLFSQPELEKKDLQKIKPDIVLIDQDLKGESEWNELFTEYKTVKWMAINFESQEIEIMHRTTRSIYSSQDLIDLLLMQE